MLKLQCDSSICVTSFGETLNALPQECSVFICKQITKYQDIKDTIDEETVNPLAFDMKIGRR